MPARKPEQEKEVLDWIGDVLGEPVPAGDFEEVSAAAANNIIGLTFNITNIFIQEKVGIKYFAIIAGSQKWSDLMQTNE